jgi:hypothetical protein
MVGSKLFWFIADFTIWLAQIYFFKFLCLNSSLNNFKVQSCRCLLFLIKLFCIVFPLCKLQPIVNKRYHVNNWSLKSVIKVHFAKKNVSSIEQLKNGWCYSKSKKNIILRGDSRHFLILILSLSFSYIICIKKLKWK